MFLQGGLHLPSRQKEACISSGAGGVEGVVLRAGLHGGEREVRTAPPKFVKVNGR